MTYLVITDNLINNLDDLDIDGLKYEKIKKKNRENCQKKYSFDDIQLVKDTYENL